MKKIFVCSPLRGDIENNIRRAKELCAETVRMGHASFAPHAFYTQFLDDTVQKERETGIAAGIEFLKVCDEVWVYAVDGITSGMQQEVDLAAKLDIPVLINPWSSI